MALPSIQVDPALVLKATPPRAARGLLQRERLSLARLESVGLQVIAVQAPTGYGKTSQLDQWRREALTRGAVTLWLSVDQHDDPLRLVRGLGVAVRQSGGQRALGDQMLRWLERCTDPQEAMTGWMAEVAQLSMDVVLFVDDVDRLPTSTRAETLPYLLGNAPANLRIVLGARPAGALMATGMLSVASALKVGPSELRFLPGETLALLQGALGARFDHDAAIRLHELTEGWPLGVQLAVAALRRSGDLGNLVAAASADIRRYFVESLLDRQSPDAARLLVRLAQFEAIHPQLVAVALQLPEAERELLRLQEETPVLVQAEGSKWMRLHLLAREVLLSRLADVPTDERRTISQRACVWLAEHGLPEEAARHALLAGDNETALSLAERTVRTMTVEGRSAAVVEWYDRLSPEELRQHPDFWAPAAWTLAMSERHAEVGPLLKLIATQSDLSEEARFEADLIAAVVAGYTDQASLLDEVVARWPTAPAQVQPDMLPIHLVSKAMSALFAGQPGLARQHWARIGAFDRSQAYSPVSYGFADYGIGLSHLWEGRCGLAEKVLRPALERAEQRMNRRSPVACMLAVLLAQACWDSGVADEAATLLALRLDVLERNGLPDAIMSAYLTLSKIAHHQGREDQALHLLESLSTIGRQREMPRLQVAAYCELVRLHARQGRAESAQQIASQLAAMVMSQASDPASRPFAAWVHLHLHLARAHAALVSDAGSRLAEVFEALDAVDALCAQLSRGREACEAQLLRAQALQRQGSAEVDGVFAEAQSLVRASGSVRLLEEHASALGAAQVSSLRVMGSATIEHGVRPPVRQGILTTKELEVLTMLTRNLSNKEIALAMGIGEQTIKWHVKNLFSKLNAAHRKHAVARAHMLGLLEG